MKSGDNMLNIYDYVVMSVTLIICAGIGIVTGRKKPGVKSTVVDYLLAGRRMSIFPVAFSIMATLMSGIAMSGGIGEMYLYGAQFQLATFASVLGKLAVAYFIVPVFHQIQYVSVYEYLELRYDRTVRLLFSFIYLIGNVFYLGVVLYVPAISLTTVTGIPYMITSSVTGIICVFYCVAGGYKAVIWTDVLQTILMFSCFVIILAKGTYDLGGMSIAIKDSVEGDRLHFDWRENEHTRYSVWSLMVGGILMAAKHYCTDQAGVQRILSVKDSNAAKNSIYISTFLMLLFKVVMILSGFVVYSYFKDCDPLRDKYSGIKSSDQLLVYTICIMLNGIPGLAGIALSGIISGSLSTISSYINAFAGLTLEDYIKPLFPKQTKSEEKNILICKILTGIYGVFCIIISFLIPYLGGAIKSYNTVVTTLGGPLVGVMFLGMFVPRTNTKVCKLALTITLMFSIWLAIGSLLFAVVHDKLPTSIERCPNANISQWKTESILASNTSFIENHHSNFIKEYIFPLHRISFMWFGSIGVLTTLLLGLIFSLIWSNDVDPDPRLLSPLVVKYQKKRKNNTKQIEMSTLSSTVQNMEATISI